jgi:hypothetical protein
VIAVVVVVVVVVVVLATAFVALTGTGRRERAPLQGATLPPRRILFPYLSNELSSPALDASLRLARTENAALVPVFLARVPLNLPLETALPSQCSLAIPLQEAIEQRAAAFGVPVDARIERGRTTRHGLRRAIAAERFDRIVIAAGTGRGPGFSAEDIAWLLEHAPGEIVVLRPGRERVAPGFDRSGPRARTRARTRTRRIAGGRGEPSGRLVVDPERQDRHDHAAARP